MLWYKRHEWSYDDVKKKMVEHYVRKFKGDPILDADRRLDITETTDTCGRKIIYFTLQGSPPKGYATWIASHRQLTLFDPHYDVWRTYYIDGGLNDNDHTGT